MYKNLSNNIMVEKVKDGYKNNCYAYNYFNKNNGKHSTISKIYYYNCFIGGYNDTGLYRVDYSEDMTKKSKTGEYKDIKKFVLDIIK